MKAKKIYETLDFERGKDPKETMKMGSFRGGEELFDMIFREAKNLPGIFDILYPKKISERDKYEWRSIPDIQENFYKEFKITLDSKVTPWIHKEIYIYLSQEGNVYFYDNEFKTTHLLKSWKDFLKYFKKTKIEEALDFERGLDPKKSMRIGKYADPIKRDIDGNALNHGDIIKDMESNQVGMITDFGEDVIEIQTEQGDFYYIKPWNIKIIDPYER